VSTTRARSGPRTLLAIAAALGLMVALALPALAARTVTQIPGNDNKTCGELGDYEFEFKIDETPSGFYDQDDPAVKVTPDVDTGFEVTITPGAGNSFSFTANLAVEAVFVKGGNDGGNLYEYDPAVLSDSGLQTPTGQQVSHVSFCWTTAPGETPTPTPTPSPTPEEETPTPTPSPTGEEPEEETPTPSPTQREGELPGNPTPTPGGGTIPDTAMGGMDQVPATVLSLIMLTALAGTAYARLARQR
jgi:hypothetical protein